MLLGQCLGFPRDDEALPKTHIPHFRPKEGPGISGKAEMNRALRTIKLLGHQARGPAASLAHFYITLVPL